MNKPPLLVEVRNCLFPYFIQFVQSIDRTCYLAEFVVVFKNITFYLGECHFGVRVRVCSYLRVCRWQSR